MKSPSQPKRAGNAERMARLYGLRFTEEAVAAKAGLWRVLCGDFFSAFVSPGDTVVDVACGHGEFINGIRAARKFAFDLNPASKNFLASGVDFRRAPAWEVGRSLRGRADVLFASNFLEHLPGKPALEKFLDEALRALKPGGRLLVMGPNLRYLPGAYWDFYDHHLGLTHLSLCEALRLRGFRIERCIPRFLPYTTLGRLPAHPLLVRLYLKFPFAWRVLGKQFFIAAAKPA